MARMKPLPTGEAKARTVQGMFDRIAPRYDLLNRMISMGMDVRWRRRTVASLGLPPGARVVDLACGTGDLSRELARAGYRPFGADFAWGMLSRAHTRAPLVQADILRLPLADASVDGATCGFALRNVVSLEAMFAEVARVVRPGGRIALLEVSEPERALLRRGASFWTNRVVPLLGGALSSREAYTYLPRSFAYLPQGEELLEMLARAGFGDLRREQLSAGIAQLIAGART